MNRQMTFADFLQSIESGSTPPAGLSPALQALWQERKGSWDLAHELAQESDGREGAWVHAYLHRKEGDESNAGYWYRHAGQPICRGDLAAEWESMARALLGPEAGPNL